MHTTAFHVVPRQPSEPDEDWASLGRAARLARLKDKSAALTAAIKERLRDMHVEYQEGLDSWTVWSERPTNRHEVKQRLQGLPVDVAPDELFYEQ